MLGGEKSSSEAPGDGDEAARPPEFFMPIARSGLLPGYLHFYHITSAKKADAADDDGEKGEHQIILTDTLSTETGTGHFCRLTVTKMGKVDSITYLGGEELQVESLWSLVGLSETFLNNLYKRWKDGDIPDIVEFLTDEWAIALFHDRFMDFCHQLKMEMGAQDEVKQLINKHLGNLESAGNLKDGLTRDLLTKIKGQLPPDITKKMEDRLLEYLRKNTNHLKAYFLPENWGQK